MPESPPPGMESPIRGVESRTSPYRGEEGKRVFHAVSQKIDADMPQDGKTPIQEAILDILRFAKEWDPKKPMSGSITTCVGSNPNAPSQVRYNIKRINDDGDFVGVGFQGTEVVLRRADLVAETVGEKFRLPDGSINEKALESAIPDESARKYFLAFLAAQTRGQDQLGEVADQGVVVEAARSMGFLMREDIIKLASELEDPETLKPYISPEDALRIIDPSTPDAEGKPLSPFAKELMDKLGAHPIVGHEQASSVLFSLGIITNSEQMAQKRGLLIERQKHLELIKDKSFAGETSDQFEKRVAQNQKEYDDTIRQLEEIEQISKTTHGGSWNLLKGYEEMVAEGEISLEKKDDILKKTFDPRHVPSEDQLQEIDKEYQKWLQETNKEERKRKRKEFLKSLVMKVGLGFGGLIAFNTWRAATKKDEK